MKANIKIKISGQSYKIDMDLTINDVLDMSEFSYFRINYYSRILRKIISILTGLRIFEVSKMSFMQVQRYS